MATRENQQGSADRPRITESPIADRNVQQQLSLLFGETLFGAWPQLIHASSASIPRRRRRFSYVKWLVVFASIAAGFVVVRGAQHGMAHRDENQRGRYAEELKVFLEDGNLERAAQYLPLVQAATDESHGDTHGTKQPYLDLVISAEAALYRYFDASPARLQKIQPYLADEGRAAPTRELAFLVILSREERAARLATIEHLGRALPKAGELEYLRATALEFRNDIDSSRRAWDRSADLEPAWLGHRFEHAWFESRQHETEGARKLAIQIAQADTDSAWPGLAAEIFSLPTTVRTRDAATPVVTPVQTYFTMLLRSIEAARSSHPGQAKDLLEKAAAAVNHQAPFLFDAFDWCLAEKQQALAKELAAMPAWPRTAPVAAAKLQRLSRLP